MAQIVYKKTELRENEAIGDIISVHDDDVELTGAGYLQFGIRKVKGTAKEVQDLLSGLMPERKEVKMWQDPKTLEWLEVKDEPKYTFSLANVETEKDDDKFLSGLKEKLTEQPANSESLVSITAKTIDAVSK